MYSTTIVVGYRVFFYPNTMIVVKTYVPTNDFVLHLQYKSMATYTF